MNRDVRIDAGANDRTTQTTLPPGEKRRTPTAAWVLIAALLLALAFFLGRRTGSPGPAPAEKPAPEAAAEKGVIRFDAESLKLADLRVEPVTARPVEAHLSLTGAVEPNQTGVVKITPRVAGKVTVLLKSVGETVRAGDALAVLASTELASSQAAYRQAGARRSVAAINLQRQRRLAATGEFGRHQLDEARGAQVAARGEVNAAATELSTAQNAVAEARSEKAAAEAEVAAARSDVANAQSEATSGESEIREAEGQVKALQAALAQARTQVKVTQSRFQRADTLLKEQLVSRQDWEQSQADYQRAQSDVDAAQANLTQGQAKIDTARAHRTAAQAKVGTMHAKVEAQSGLVQQAAAKIETALSRVEQARARLETARRQEQIAGQALAREQKVFQGGYFTSKELVEAEAALRQAEAEQRAAAEQVRLLGGEPGAGNAIRVTAPIAGRVTERTVTLGETVAPEQPLFTVINLSSVWAQLSIYPKDFASVRTGQAVTVTSDAAPGRVFHGAVSYVGDVVDETTRTVKVRAVIQNEGDLLKPQTFVRGTIATAHRTEALSVPRDAVQDLEGKRVLFVADDQPGEFRAREVQTGEVADGSVVVTAGLKPGERVVTHGAFLVKAQAMKSELKEE